jgi:hypothetical protein
MSPWKEIDPDNEDDEVWYDQWHGKEYGEWQWHGGEWKDGEWKDGEWADGEWQDWGSSSQSVDRKPSQPTSTPPARLLANNSQHPWRSETTQRKRVEPWTQIEPWVTTKFDAQAWKGTLDEYEVDIIAQKELFLLSQYSEEGARHANSVIAHFLKSVSDGREIRNPSGFIHSSCLKSRHKLEGASGQSSWRD